MHGALIVDKPEGLTSHDVVAAVRRLLPRGTKVGHTGTLDPFATGVLPVVVGKATRLARFLTDKDKRYRATVAFGTSTTTCDRTGAPVDTADPTRREALTSEAIATALARLVGTHPQVPPVFSAKKIDGERAYERARRGDDTPPAAVMVTAHALDLMRFDPADGLAVVEVRCAAGYYVRALARDLGAALGVPAHLDALRRTAAGSFAEGDAHALDDVLRAGDAGVGRMLRPMSSLLPDVPAVTIDAVQRRGVRHGQAVECASSGLVGLRPDEPVRLLDGSGHLLAMARATPLPAGRLLLHPDVVVMTDEVSEP